MTSEIRVLREWEAAKLMGVSTAALRRWRREGRGPKFRKMERCIGYLLSDLETYLTGPERERHRERQVR
jgi:predicted DNA-binding transcriptional regulator AlpA